MPSQQSRLLKALDLLTAPRLPEVESLGAVRRNHIESVRSVFDNKNVVAVGISEKSVADKPSGELSVCFYVEKKLPLSKVSGADVVPQAISLPGDASVFTDVKEIGKLRPEVNQKRSPIQAGFSVAHIKIAAGTVGAIVKRGGRLHILSNSHVLALGGKAKLGDKIVYPGPADGGALPADLVASLAFVHPFDTSGAFVNRVDAALAEITAARLSDINLAIAKAVKPLGTVLPKRDMKVVKVGRTTGQTTGKVIDVNFRFVLTYPGVGKVAYIDQVLCSRYTDGGDSGSIVVDSGSGKIVGLHFAGANGGSVFNPIRPVMAALKFQFA